MPRPEHREQQQTSVRKAKPDPEEWLEAIIGLPAGLFYGTGIPACVLVMNKKGADDPRARPSAAHHPGQSPVQPQRSPGITRQGMRGRISDRRAYAD